MHREIILSNIGKANGLTIDHSARKLYWADLYTPAIDSFDLLTRKRVAIITENIVYPFSITQYQDYIYWTDWNTGKKVHKIINYVTITLLFLLLVTITYASRYYLQQISIFISIDIFRNL